MMRIRLLLLLLLALLLLPGTAAAQGGVPGHSGQPEHGTAPGPGPGQINDPLKDVAYEQKLGAQLPLSLPFVDEAGKAVTLGDYFGAKPVVLILGYYECPMLCSLVRDGAVAGLMDVSLDAGKDFQVVNVSIDPTETPMNAANTKAAIVSRYGRAGAEDGWHFLTGTQDSIQQLADTIGFKYFYDETIDQYAHAAGIVVVTPGGELSHYFYGIEFNPSDLRLGLVEASGNKIGSPVDQLLLLCYHYDPTTGRYSGAIMTAIRVVSVLFMVGMVAGVYFLGRGPRRPGSPHGPAQAAG
jgi:protein SCO1/2